MTVEWVVEERTLGAVEWVADGTLGFTQAELDAMPSYQACIGAQIQSCNAAFPNWQSDADQLTALNACIETAKGTCKLQVELSATQTLSPAAITALQNQINTELKKYDYCPIGADGALGGETCGAAIWAAGTGAPIIVPSQCNSIKNTFQLKDCPSGGGGGGGGGEQVECDATIPCVDPNRQCVDGKCVPKPAAPAAKSNWGLFVLGTGAAAALFFGLRASQFGAGGKQSRHRGPRDNPRRKRQRAA